MHPKIETSQLEEAVKPGKSFFKTNDNEHLGKTTVQITNKLREGSKFTGDEETAITEYTGHYEGNDAKDRSSWHSHQINNALARGKQVTKAKNKRILAGMDSAIANNPIRHRVSTYSGVSFDPRTKLDEKGRFTSPAFISTTHDKSIAKTFAYGGHRSFSPTHIIHFHLEPGDPAAHISHKSAVPAEHETIIGRGTTLQHMGTDSQWDAENEHYVHTHKFKLVR